MSVGWPPMGVDTWATGAKSGEKKKSVAEVVEEAVACVEGSSANRRRDKNVAPPLTLRNSFSRTSPAKSNPLAVASQKRYVTFM